MQDEQQTIDWRQLREFADVDLAKSYVLSWHYDGAALLIELDLHLLPSHPFYERPRPAQKVCIRPAVLEFPYCDTVSFDGGDAGLSTADVTARLGLGAIRGLEREHEGSFHLSGEFGTVTIDAERPILRLRDL